MRVGVLEILRPERSSHWTQSAYAHYILKQYASVMPQAISVWCRQLGHESFYATYYGQGDAKDLLPSDLDLVFISTYTQASALAYALAKLFRREGTLTVIGGPHSKAFPDDCRRFFDVVVLECDKTLLRGHPERRAPGRDRNQRAPDQGPADRPGADARDRDLGLRRR